MTSFRKLILVLFVPFLPVVTLPAALLFSESFDTPPYTAGSDLTGQQGWTGSSVVEVDAAGLTHPAITGASGGSIRGVTGFTNNGGGRVTSPGVGSDGTSSGTRWFSFLISMTDNSGVDANGVNLIFDEADGQNLQVGLQDNQYVVNDSTANISVTTQYTEGTTALIVGKLDVVYNDSETVSIWFNPSQAGSESQLTSSADATFLNQNINVVFQDWGAFQYQTDMFGSNLNTWYQDQIRVGESLSDLSLIPEPSSLALIGLALAAVLGLRRRG